MTGNILTLQIERPEQKHYCCLSDFIAPATAGLIDHIGMFAVSILGAEVLCDEFERNHDDYNSILVKALADRLAEVQLTAVSIYFSDFNISYGKSILIILLFQY